MAMMSLYLVVHSELVRVNMAPLLLQPVFNFILPNCQIY